MTSSRIAGEVGGITVVAQRGAVGAGPVGACRAGAGVAGAGVVVAGVVGAAGAVAVPGPTGATLGVGRGVVSVVVVFCPLFFDCCSC